MVGGVVWYRARVTQADFIQVFLGSMGAGIGGYLSRSLRKKREAKRAAKQPAVTPTINNSLTRITDSRRTRD